jgi:ClpP class serine protease
MSVKESRLKPKSHDRIFSELFGTPWLISEEWMGTIIEIAKRQTDFDAVSARKANYMDNAEKAKQYGNKAVIPISGPIFPKANMMTDFSGATSIESLARDIDAAVKNDAISEIILDIDSPGGHVTGVNEMANMIRAYSDQKKITSYVSGNGASAAYWLASSGSEIVVDATSRVGSIGVVVAYPKGSGDSIEIVNTASPNKRPDISTDEGKQVVVEQMDALADVFVSSVAKFRGVSEKVVLKDFGRGGILVGEHAVNAGMADRLGSFEQLLKENGGNSMPDKGTKADLTVDSLKADNPKVYDSIHALGASEASENASTEITAKDDQIKALEKTVAETKEENTNLVTRVDALEKRDTMRDEKDIQSSANAIVISQLSTSTLSVRQRTKVEEQMVAPDAFVTDGKLDVEKYTEAVDAEISDWEDMLAETAGSVQGLGTQTKKEEDETTEDKDVVDEMLKMAGVE